jgi:L-cysteine/cystine lyase
VVPPDRADAERLALLRDALPALSAGIYLNTGSVGPLPAETAAAMAEMADHELRIGRAHVDSFALATQRMDEARAAVAAVLTADVDDIALTHATTDGMNIGAWAIDWKPGDRVVTTNLEHPGGIGPLYLLRDRLGVDLHIVDVGLGGDREALLAAFDAAIDDRTRMVSLSHVLWATGAVLPIPEIAALAHARGAVVVVDGAQSAGAIPVDLAATGADVYAIPAQKWLMGPEGMGAVAVTRAARERLAPTFAGHFTFEQVDSAGLAKPWASARRFEGSSFHRPSVVGMARSIGWLSMFIGLDWVYRRGAEMAGRAHDRLAAIDGVTVLTPRHAMAGLIAFRVAGWPAQSVFEELGARTFAITRTLPLVDAVRLSVACFTTDDELERVATCLELLAAHTPETVPPRRSLTLLG